MTATVIDLAAEREKRAARRRRADHLTLLAALGVAMLAHWLHVRALRG